MYPAVTVKIISARTAPIKNLFQKRRQNCLSSTIEARNRSNIGTLHVLWSKRRVASRAIKKQIPDYFRVVLLLLHAYFLRGFGNCFCSSCGKSFDAAGGVDELRLARVERVALVANFHVNRGHRGARRKGVPARAGNFCLVVYGVDISFSHA